MQKQKETKVDVVEVVDTKQTKITDWYNKLLDDLWELAQTKVIEFKHQIGSRIIQDWDKFGKSEYGDKFVENLAKDLQIGTRDIYRCIQFARTFPTLDKLQETINSMNSVPRDRISWRWIRDNLLPEHKEDKIETPPLPEGKYQIIYADPAWKYWSGGWKNQEQHYTTMDLEEIKQLPVQTITDDNCILFMWATFPYLKETIEVMESWGFKYSTVGFVWVKKTKNSKYHFGCGSWTRANAEICLIGVKGSIERKDASISQIIDAPVEEHSKKPDVVRDKIIQLVGDLPRIELFARKNVEGWDSWGDELSQ
jgi:N6-adenosine-specific RNA methylase IME4